MLGGCLVLAGRGFTTSSKRGGWEVTVPVPEAYAMAAIMFSLSALAVIWLLRQCAIGVLGRAVAVPIYFIAAAALTRALRQVLW